MTIPLRPSIPYPPDKPVEPPYLRFVLTVLVTKTEQAGQDQTPETVGQTLIEDVIYGIDFWAQDLGQEEAVGYNVASVEVHTSELVPGADHVDE